MAFRKRNIALGQKPDGNNISTRPQPVTLPGVRFSPLTSNPTTSTGTASLDGLLGGHAGLILGSSLLIEESGTTDYAGALLRFYAAEGICQGHVVHVVGVGDAWVRDLPGVADAPSSKRSEKPSSADQERMKIAWRYEGLAPAGERALPDRSVSNAAGSGPAETPFVHTFDLTKRLTIPPTAKINHISLSSSTRPFDSVLAALSKALASSQQGEVHRLVIPTILSPALYPPTASQPKAFLRFLHSLRALLHQYSDRLTAVMTLPLELYPRQSGLIRWAEILSDGVLELTPFPHLMDASNNLTTSGGARSEEEQPQGMLRVHKLPLTTERGEGGAGAGNSIGEDLAFTVSRRKFVIKPFSLPPLEGDQQAQQEAGKVVASKDVEF